MRTATRRKPTPRQMLDLEWALSVGATRFYRSTFGAMLSRQAEKVAAGAHLASVWAHNAAIVTEPGRSSEELVPLSTTFCRSAGRHEATYEPELAELHRFGYVSRALYRLEKTRPDLVAVLMAYHGDAGSRWGYERPEGRLLAVYSHTPTGRRWAESMRRRHAEMGVELHMLRDDERLAVECQAQSRAPTDIRRARLRRIDDEAKAMLDEAHAAYCEVLG